MTRSISRSRPMTGSSLPSPASLVRLRPYCSRTVALVGLLRGGAAEARHTHVGGSGAGGRLGLGAGQLGNGVAHGIARDPHLAQGVHGAAVALRDDAEQEVLGRDVGLAVGHRLAVGALEHALGARRERDVAAGHRLDLARGEAADGGERLVVGDVELGERLGGNALALLDERQEQVLGANVHLPETAGLVLGEAHDLASLVGELLEHRVCPPHGFSTVIVCTHAAMCANLAAQNK